MPQKQASMSCKCESCITIHQASVEELKFGVQLWKTRPHVSEL